MLEAERAALIEARDAGRYDDDVLRAVTAMLDVEESLLDRTELRHERIAADLAPARTHTGLRAPHGGADPRQAADAGRLRGVPARRHRVGASAAVPQLRPRRLL